VTDVQLYLAIGIPTLAVLAGILTNAMQMNALNARISSGDTRISSLDTRISSLESRLDGRFNSLEAPIDSRFNSLEVKFDTLIGKVIDLDNRVTRIEAKLGIS
jgi:chromosome segregation ATPase